MKNQPYKGSLLVRQLNTCASVLESSCSFPWRVLVSRSSLLVPVWLALDTANTSWLLDLASGTSALICCLKVDICTVSFLKVCAVFSYSVAFLLSMSVTIKCDMIPDGKTGSFCFCRTNACILQKKVDTISTTQEHFEWSVVIVFS